MKKSTLLIVFCVFALTLSHFPSSSSGFGQDDMFDFAMAQLNKVSKKVIKSLHRVSGGSPRPGKPGPPVKKGFGNNKFISAMLQINRAMAEARGMRRITVRDGFLNNVARLAVAANELKDARVALGYSLHEDYKKHCRCVASRGRGSRCTSTSSSVDQLRNILGDEKFNMLLGIEGDVALIFVMDTTGSMQQEIDAAKTIIRSIASYDRQANVNYTFSPFSDPYPATGPQVQTFTNTTQFLTTLDRLRASGGGDCKELTFHGIIDAIDVSKPPIGSPMFVFTDAGPKDENADDIYNLDNAVGKALDYMIAVNFFFSSSPGGCTGPETFESFRTIIEETDGFAMLYSSTGKLQQMGEVVTSALDGITTIKSGGSGRIHGRLKSRPPGLGVLRRRYSAAKRYKIPVDDSVERLIVLITVQRNSRLVTLLDPKGRNTTKTHELVYGAIWIIKKPALGSWTLTVPSSAGSHSFKVTSSSVINIDFDHYFIRRLQSSSHVEIPISAPLKGQQAIVKLLLPLKEKLRLKSLSLDIVGKDGRTLSTATLHGNTATFHPPRVPFKLRLRGRTKTGFQFERLSRRIITAMSAIIRMVYNRNYFTLPRGRKSTVRFAIHNSGATAVFKVRLTISLPKIRITRPRRLHPTDNSLGSFRVLSGRARYVSAALFVPRTLRRGQFTSVLVTATCVGCSAKARLNVHMMIL